MRFLPPIFLLSWLFLAGSTAKAEFGLHAASHFEFGTFGGEQNDSYSSRSVGAFDLQALPGYHPIGPSLLVGLMFDLRFFTQLAGKGPIELGGRTFTIGPAASFEVGSLKLLAGWDIRARHSTSTPSITYSGSGWRVLLGYRLKGNWWADLQFLSTKYNARTVDDTGFDMTAYPIKSSMVGFGVSWSY